jgi:hypothetical protein
MVAGLAVVAAACGSDDGSLEGYFESLSEVTANYEADVAGLPVAGTQSTLDEARTFFTGVGVAVDRMLAGLDDISTPDDVEAAHAELVDSATEFATLAGQVAARGQELGTPDDLRAMAGDSLVGVANFSAVAALVVVACSELQSFADAGTTDIDLNCSALGRE